MPVVSKTGHHFSMNIIDDFSGYVWSLPLKAKSDAASTLITWHRAVENQMGQKLKILITDNGELISRSVHDWCSMHGIDHQLTAPYTSAQNGRVERLHRTLLGRARSMRLACNAPAHLWDEFCATAAYLTNLTMSSSANGTTPHEKWFGTVPSLSHLCEIGCRAFSLIQTHNPKLFHRSTPCTLIGYAPHSKAYRLWDNTTGAIFNSFHVTFVEHLDALPSDLLPGTTVTLDADVPPSWETPSPDLTSLSLRSDPSDTYPGTPASILSHAPFLPTFPPESESPSVAPSPVDPPPIPSLPLPSSSSSSPHPTPDTSQVPAAPPAPDTPAPWRSE